MGKYTEDRRGFTLLEFIIVIAVLAILVVAVVVALNPAETLKIARDSRRLNDLFALKEAIALALVDAPDLDGPNFSDACEGDIPNNKRVFFSVPLGETPPALLSGWFPAQVSQDNLFRVDGSGWIPVNFSAVSGASPFTRLPIDPINTFAAGFYYTYVCQRNPHFELTARLESSRYRAGGANDKVSVDGGDEPLVYEIGTNLKFYPGTQDGEESSMLVGGPANPQQIPVKLLVVIYNPVLEAQGGQRLSEFYGWSNPDTLTAQLMADFNTFSHGIVKYELVERVERDEWPLHANGERYTDELYLEETANHNWTLGAGDYNAIIINNLIAQKVNVGLVDEVWLWGAPGFGWWESAMAGQGAFWINGGPISGVSSKAFVLMGLSYERGLAEALESYAHRTESIIRRVYGSWAATETHDWNRFTLLDRDVPGRGGIGNAHNAFNAEPSTDYNRESLNTVSTSADDWYNFPNMTGARTDKNCTAWSCDGYLYLKWWYDHMPHVIGLKNGLLTTWWRYIADPNQYKSTWQFLASAEIDLAESNATAWSCAAASATCFLASATDNIKTGVSSIKFDTTGAFDTWVRYPAVGGANWDVSTKTYFTFWAYAINPSPTGFQDFSVRLKNDNGSAFLYGGQPAIMNSARGSWKKATIPLAGGDGWMRTSTGSPTLADIDQIEIHNDTWDAGFTIYFDGLGFAQEGVDATSPNVSFVSPLDGATVAGIVPVTVAASDDQVVFRVDLFVDNQYVATDAIFPYIFQWDTTSLPAGFYLLTAKAFDHFGNAGTSGSVGVAVQ